MLGRDSFDPYPFIFLNLVLSMVAAIQAPVIMMSQNRQSQRDRLDAAHDYEVNLKAEIEIMALHEKLDEMRHSQIIGMRDEIALLSAQLKRIGEALEKREPSHVTDTVHLLIEKYGLIAVFLGCVAEGESAAIIAGFFSHQRVFVPWQAFVAVFAGAFGGDTMFFLFGRRFSDHHFVQRMREKPGFDRAFRLVNEHPVIYVLVNRYIYGFRLVGGVAAGLSGIRLPLFLVLNALSALVWTALFGGIGYIFGIGAERIIGDALLKHERLLIALAIGLAAAVVAGLAAHYLSRRSRA